MDSIGQIMGPYPTIKISPQTKRVEVEGNTEEQNDALNERLQGENNKYNFDNVRFKSVKQSGSVVQLPLNVFSCSDELRNTGNEVCKSMIGFFEKNKSTDDIKKEFRDTFEKVKKHYMDAGLSEGSDEDLKKIIYETYYEYRHSTLFSAQNACGQEGERLYPKTEPYEAREYYNSDFYYLNEDAKTAFAEEAQAIAKDYGLGEVDLPLTSNMPVFYDNFNTICSRGHGVIINGDTDVPPPKNFSYFYKDTREESYLELSLGDSKWRVDNPLNNVKGGVTTFDKIFDSIGKNNDDISSLRPYLRKFTLRRGVIAAWSLMTDYGSSGQNFNKRI